MIELVALGAVVLLVVVAVLYRRRIRRLRTDEDEDEERTVSETIQVTEHFERVHATATYQDGSEESIEYDRQEETNSELTAFTTLDEDCFKISTSVGRRNYPKVTQDVPKENKRYINLGNVRDIDIDRVTPLVAVADVDVEKTQTKTPRRDWRTTHYSYEYTDVEYEFEIWEQIEYEAYYEER